jgi:hypothetical protein
MSVSCAKMYLAEKKCLHWEFFDRAAMNGKVEVLEWAQDSGYDLKQDLANFKFDAVAKKGHLNVVKFMSHLRIMPLTEFTFSNAAVSGNLDLLEVAESKWLSNGCESVCVNSISRAPRSIKVVESIQMSME